MMELRYKSTRSDADPISASQAILKGLADDGGLFVPESIPALDVELEALSGLSYKETAYEVMKLFLTDFTKEELQSCIDGAYDGTFDVDEIVPLVKKDGAYYLELFHGRTIAFKDMALSILPYLMTTAAKKNGVKHEIVILTATSGDTGKAALAGFADVPGTSIIVFYPKNGVSPIQEKQMVTQKGKNTHVVGIQAGYQFSSANSINIGRLVPQIVYYVYAYGRLLREGEISCGEKIHVVVPTGNFGNILAAYYAKNMGLPIETLFCASNENKVLFDFFQTGTYDRKREFILTSSPSMDILISSNLERLIYQITGEDAAMTRELMEALAAGGEYRITDEMQARLHDFIGGYATEDETRAAIRAMYERTGYVMDTHTAVASHVYYDKAQKTGYKTVIASTASPYKFTRSVMNALGEDGDGVSDLALADQLEKLSGVAIPKAIEEIRSADVLHDTICDRTEMEKTVREILGLPAQKR